MYKSALKLYLPALVLVLAGMVTMNTIGESGDFFTKQLWWLVIATVAFVGSALYDPRPLRQRKVLVGLYLGILIILGLLFALGSVFGGAQSWFDLGWFALQPADPAKIILILILAKYFAIRHVEIASLRHVIASALYMAPIAILLILQPDFGSAMVIVGIWLMMLIVSGIPFKRLLGMAGLGIVAIALAWNFVFLDYQKERIETFFDPYADISGSGYNVYQSLVAVSAGGMWGRGLGEGTQSRLQFLPESETDFIFASFVEEWGIAGAVLVFVLFGMIIFELVKRSRHAESNFESLYLLGLASLLLVHFVMHVGINLGVLPATGITLPFMSYGGSHLITTFLALGLAVSMSRRSRYVSNKELTFVD